MPGDDGFQLGDVHVALERVGADHFQTLVGNDLLHHAAIERDVRLGGGEVIVHRYHRTLRYQCLREDVLAGTALVRGQEVIHAEDLVQLALQARVGGAAGVAVIGNHHGGLLLVAHGVHAAVGQHVHEDILVLQQEGVVACFGDRREALLHRNEIEFLHNANLVHFERNLFAAEEFDVCHGWETSDFLKVETRSRGNTPQRGSGSLGSAGL